MSDDVLAAVAGVNNDAFCALYDKYGDVIHHPYARTPPPSQLPHTSHHAHWTRWSTMRRKRLYNLLAYAKMYPLERQLSLVFGREHRNVLRGLRKTAATLAPAMDDVAIAWHRRHHPHNRLPHWFDHSVTAALDTFPLVIRRPMDAKWQAKTWNDKYRERNTRSMRTLPHPSHRHRRRTSCIVRTAHQFSW